MSLTLRCPKCETSLRLAAAPTAGQKVKCPKCGTAFSPESEPPKAPPRPAVAPLSLPDEDEAPAPVREPVMKARRDDEEPPRSAPKRRREPDEDEDEDRRPRRRKKEREKGGGFLIGLLVGGGFAALLGIGGLVWALSSKKADPEAAAPAPADNQSPAKGSNPRPNTGPGPIAGLPPAPESAAPSKDLLEKTKRATARIRVEAGTQAASGSGFLVRANPDAAYVVTNYHVIDLREEEPKADPGPPGFPGRPPGFPARPPVVRPPGFGPPGFPGFGPKQPAQKQRVRAKVYVVLNSGTPE